MFISVIAAWICVVCTVLTSCKVLARKSKNKKLNRIFRKVHIPVGMILCVMGLFHGLVAGNMRFASMSEMTLGSVLFTPNFGTLCYFFALLLAISYLLRKKLKKKWMKIHRILTVLMLVTLVFHVANVGISLFSFKVDAIPEEPSVLTTAVPETESVAMQTETQPEITVLTTQSETTEAVTVLINTVRFSGAVLQDGTYTGKGQGYKGTVTVSVTVENGAVTVIDVLSNKDTPQYFNRATDVISRIIQGQSLQVDGVTGASYSSAGIKNAVRDALQNAVIEGILTY